MDITLDAASLRIIRDMAKSDIAYHAPDAPDMVWEQSGTCSIKFPPRDPVTEEIYKQAQGEYSWACKQLKALENG